MNTNFKQINIKINQINKFILGIPRPSPGTDKSSVLRSFREINTVTAIRMYVNRKFN